MTQYIYARTSTAEQNVKQQADLLSNQYPTALTYLEQASGKTCDRIVFNQLKELVQSGDTIIVLSVSRLGRNTVQVLEFIELMKSKNIAVLVYDLGSIDVTSSMGKLVLTTLAAVAEMQRDEILDKQRIGIERAKAEGKYQGKQQSQITINKCNEALCYIEQGLSKEKSAKAAGIGIATLYRFIKEGNAHSN
ncbi:recombinase family protein [Shewanella sp.]|uniref:recombinase family protein n=1 Tax=Shewanella sp. TaxID=50422 RepID=UPI004048BDB6